MEIHSSGFASQYGVDPYQLAAENGMTIWSAIVPGGSLEVSGATTAVEETAEASSSEVTATDSDATWNRYPVGQCTWGVKESLHGQVTEWGNGGSDWAGSLLIRLCCGFNTCDGIDCMLD